MEHGTAAFDGSDRLGAELSEIGRKNRRCKFDQRGAPSSDYTRKRRPLRLDFPKRAFIAATEQCSGGRVFREATPLRALQLTSAPPFPTGVLVPATHIVPSRTRIWR